jgi:ring-1,2-phenylacetyl-CoA epoxidase subunit PaaD
MVKETLISQERIREILNGVMDPEILVLSVTDLGIIRDINLKEDDIEVVITPTYSGCPAMDVIATQIRMELLAAGAKNVKIVQVLTPAWTTEWMSEEGKRKLEAYGIAPPNAKQQVCDNRLFAEAEAVTCPHCHSWHTIRVSEFGSTPCKALYRCEDCLEPFDYFKCH